MSDEEVVAGPVEDNQIEDAPETGTSDFFEDKFDVNKLPDELRGQYDEMRADYTRKTQTLAEQRKEMEQHQEQVEFLGQLQNDPQLQTEFIRSLGYDIEGLDPQDEVASRLEALEMERVQEQKMAQLQEIYAEAGSHVESELSRLGKDLSDAEKEWVSEYVLDTWDLETGEYPDVEGTVKRLRGVRDGWQKSWLEAKQAPPVDMAGGSGSKEIDIRNERARRDFLASGLQATR